MGTDKYIQVLMSTYNGEKYLREQLDSIVAQKNFQNICVLIRDDGSTDGTVQILQEYHKRYGFEIHIEKNIGVNASILKLIEYSNKNCCYFAICDQDDVWMPDKMQIAVKMLEQCPQDKPCLFASLSEIVDENLKHLGSSVFPIRGVSYYNALLQNVTAGHTQVMNTALKNLLDEQGVAFAHVIDWWIYLVASGMGKVMFHPDFTVRHRQHGSNAVGYRLSPCAKIKKRLQWIKNGKGNQISKQIKGFYQLYGDLLPEEYRIETEHYLSCNRTLISRIAYAFTCKAYRQQKIENLLFKILYMVGKYRI